VLGIDDAKNAFEDPVQRQSGKVVIRIL
jgi:hypothetical protein